MDYGAMVAQHVRVGADMTVGCIEVELEQAGQFGIMAVDAEHRIRSFREKPAHPEPMPGRRDRALASMGIYVFNSGFLFEQLVKDADQPRSTHDFGKDIIPDVVTKYRVMAYPFQDVPGGDQAYLARRGDRGCLLGGQPGAHRRDAAAQPL